MSVEIAFESALAEGREPVRRLAYLVDNAQRDLLVSAQGNLDDDRWVLGWEPLEGPWHRIVRGAVAAHDYVLGQHHSIQAMALYDDEFEPAGRNGRSTSYSLLDDLRTMLSARDGKPSLIAISNDIAQIEVIFEPDFLRPAMITLLTNSRDAAKYTSFFSRFHAIGWTRGNEDIVQRLLDGICSNNQYGENSWEQRLKFSVDTLN